MPTRSEPIADAYESFYREFDSPLMRRVRLEAYGEDIGQNSWVSAPELPADAVAKELVPHVNTLIAAIDADIAGKADYQSKLTAAADHMPMTAAILANGIVANKKIES